ncbi:hypothetical protein ACTAQI_00895 [Pseudarthrobacter sp. alpha12b]
MKDRIEIDTLGPVAVPAGAYWGAHTMVLIAAAVTGAGAPSGGGARF